MKALHIVSFVVFGYLTVGCTNHSADDEGEFATRLKAAGAVRGTDDREEAFSKIALDAAEANRPEVVMKCLGGISTVDLRDQTASKAAVRLANAGAEKAALKTAGVILNTGLRDETLKRIANPD